MIFFAQGNGDDKIEANKEYFEDEWCYLKPLDGEDFKVDVRKLLEKKLPLQKLENPVNPAIRTKEETVNLPTTSSGQSSISSETSKNSSNNSDSAWSSIKNFFYSLFSGFISFITGLFTS
ncbi:MAG TPA: hypothetical protein VL201_00475 [Patescibacteria group bacterium]|nr:hypothetical protein [Patescibacteria group bacterium]